MKERLFPCYVVTLCSLVDRCWHFGRICCLHTKCWNVPLYHISVLKTKAAYSSEMSVFAFKITCVTTQKTTIWTLNTVKASELTLLPFSFSSLTYHLEYIDSMIAFTELVWYSNSWHMFHISLFFWTQIHVLFVYRISNFSSYFRFLKKADGQMDSSELLHIDFHVVLIFCTLPSCFCYLMYWC